MIQVMRSAPPPVLQRRADLWKEKLLRSREAHDRASGPKRRKTARALGLAEEKYRHRDVKEALVELFHGKCAYCESKILHIDYGHIEHYRPKSRFPEQTFAWANLLLACGVCNGAAHKGDRFPTAAEGGPLLDPCKDDPSEHLHFRFDPKTLLASVYGRTRRGRTTAKLLGLNRPALRAYRSQQVRQLAALARFAAEDDQARELLEAAARKDGQYAAFARVLLRSLP